MGKTINLSKILMGLILSIIVFFLFYSYHHFIISEKFNPLPLSFNPYNSTSTYDWNGAIVIIQGGFVKGKIIDGKKEELLLRALAPNQKISIKSSNQDRNYSLRLENINPVKTIIKSGAQLKIIDPHTVSLDLDLKSDEEKTLELGPKEDQDNLEIVVLGDNRNGYQTFSQIVDQINDINPAFTIDNGDLVFGGEPNRYRLFNETLAKLHVPLYTTLGNHDIREGGRTIYTKLFGPPYYAFDYHDNHFIFLDSSRGWAEKRAIPEEQYQWLEDDLKKAQGKRIFVISHIPSTDPRSKKELNNYVNIPGVQKTNWFEREMNNYILYKNLDHAFPDKQEALRFETLMSKYKVNTVFLSHIHSYFSFLKGGVHYIISGGGGAELLTEGSYYHYIRVKVSDKENYLEVVQLPSPTNQLQDRFIAALQLFTNSIYKEYTTYVIGIGIITTLILIWTVWINRYRWWPYLQFIVLWLYEIFKFAVAKYKEMKAR